MGRPGRTACWTPAPAVLLAGRGSRLCARRCTTTGWASTHSSSSSLPTNSRNTTKSSSSSSWCRFATCQPALCPPPPPSSTTRPQLWRGMLRRRQQQAQRQLGPSLAAPPHTRFRRATETRLMGSQRRRATKAWRGGAPPVMSWRWWRAPAARVGAALCSWQCRGPPARARPVPCPCPEAPLLWSVRNASGAAVASGCLFSPGCS